MVEDLIAKLAQESELDSELRDLGVDVGELPAQPVDLEVEFITHALCPSHVSPM
jgi:hypothetical protein